MSNKPNDMTFAYVADGFTDDCDELIHHCAKVDILKFEYFSDIWKDMQLANIFHGRASGAELAELSEEVLNVAKSYMVADTQNIEESVAGLFLVYTLLNLQPYPGFACIRLVPEDMPAIERLELTARKQKRHDLLYILGSVLIRGPSQYHVAHRERGLEPSLRKYLEGYNSVQRAGTRPKGVFYRQNEESDILRELNGIARRYATAKAALSDKRNLSYTNDALMSELDSSLKNLISGVFDDGKDDTEASVNKLNPTSIKERAMKSKVLPMKHLITVEGKSPSPTKKAEKKTTPSPKRKSGHDVKSPNKRKHPQSIKIIPSDQDDSESDLDINLFDKPEASPSKKKKSKTAKKSPQIKKGEVKKRTGETMEQEIEIEIDLLPSTLKAEQNGQMYEIEIIDKLKDKSNGSKTKSVKTKRIASTKSKAATKVNKKSIVDSNPGDTAKGPSAAPELRIKRREKDIRELKRSVLKSKLNRYGTLPLVQTEIDKSNKGSKDVSEDTI